MSRKGNVNLQPVRVVVVDDNSDIRNGLRGLLEALGVSIVGEAGNGREAIEQAYLLRPELMLLDVSMPVMGGFAAARILRRSMPHMRIIFVSQHGDSAYAEEALELGASAYVLKRTATVDLPRAFDAAMSGRAFISAAARSRVSASM